MKDSAFSLSGEEHRDISDLMGRNGEKGIREMDSTSHVELDGFDEKVNQPNIEVP